MYNILKPEVSQQAAVEDEVKTFPQLSGFIEETCLKCHAPMGVTHAHHTGAVQRLLDDSGFIEVEGRHDLAGRPRIVSARRIL